MGSRRKRRNKILEIAFRRHPRKSHGGKLGVALGVAQGLARDVAWLAREVVSGVAWE